MGRVIFFNLCVFGIRVRVVTMKWLFRYAFFLHCLQLCVVGQAQDMQQQFLSAHNDARANVGVGELLWNDTVAAYAQNYANQRIADCALMPSGGPYGENLLKESSNAIEIAVTAWVSERRYYNYLSNSCSEGRFCGHYTQVVWGDSKRLGCAEVQCNDGWIFVICNYDPPGNIVGQRPYEKYAVSPGISPIPHISPIPDISPIPHISPIPDISPIPPPSTNLTAPPNISPIPRTSTNLTAPPGNSLTPRNSTNLTPLSGNSTQPSAKTSSKRVPILVGSGVVGTALIVMLCLVLGRRIRHWKSCVRKDNNLAAKGNFGQVLFDYKVLRDSTGNFHRNNILGKGGFGEVYKGRLPDGMDVAVKKLNGKQTNQAVEEFLREVKLISSVHHRNLVRLLGCCKRGHKRLLVYEFMSNNSLEKHLFGEIRNALSWEKRLKIIVGTAQGLAYLHGESNVRIIHRDIKCANILLNDRFDPKIADFGLARFFPESQTHVSTRFGGTVGYTAPEYAVHGQLTEKADVYSYGIVVLEIVSGRKSVDARLPTPLQLLLEWAWNQFEQNQVLDIVDSSLDRQYPREQALRVIKVALLCTQGSWALRPAMSTVVSMLNNDSEIIAQPTRPAFIEAAADRPSNFTHSPESAASAAAPPQGSHGSISVSLFPR